MKTIQTLTKLTGLVFLLVAGSPAMAQELTFTEGSQTFSTSLSDLTNSSGTSSGWTFEQNLTVLSGPGWVHSDASGMIYVAQNPLVLDDPFVTYSIAFQNSTASNETFSASFSTPFDPVTYDPSVVRAFFSGTIADGTGNQDGSGTLAGVVGTPSQTTTLTLNSGGTVDLTQLSLSPGPGDVTPGQGIDTFEVTTPGYPNYIAGPSGTYKSITVTTTVTLTPGAFIGLVGRADVIPEPSTYAFFMIGGVFMLLAVVRRKTRV